jgi:hypothetical protein
MPYRAFHLESGYGSGCSRWVSIGSSSSPSVEHAKSVGVGYFYNPAPGCELVLVPHDDPSVFSVNYRFTGEGHTAGDPWIVAGTFAVVPMPSPRIASLGVPDV